MSVTERPLLAEDDPRHGTANGYNNHRCRCDACRESWRIYEPLKAAGIRYRCRRRERARRAT